MSIMHPSASQATQQRTLWAKLLGIEYWRLALDVSPMTVHHAEFVLNEQEQSDFTQRLVEAATAEWMQAFLAECATARQNIRRDRSFVRNIMQPT